MPDEERTAQLSTDSEGGDDTGATGDESEDQQAGLGSDVDQLGIPMSRAPTLDDVRGDSESHRRLALGCSVVVLVAVAGFWVIRVLWLG